ncbi:hypothetical protein [Pseudomonas turukhanskensis]|uniref:Uncharacterized protein n=1 Tax=Pseudomonas turukhanskensis TaxID=1806536 RepID=A0A9W6K7E7_9PSED|nr:hypothetical protein [Pseudomonas turukhanskensis]GLK89616.1 hypothetical protein GCM10017655_26780 [Pseudomonas turukhanskensis]
MTDHTHTSSDTPEETNRDSIVDAWAILILIALAVSTAVFWVSHQ